MAEQRTEREEDRSASVDHNNGEHLVFFEQDRATPDDLLKSSNEFIRLYEEHQPELQQIINQLLMWTDDFLDDYGKAAKGSSGRRIAAAVGAGVGVGAGVLAVGAFLAAVSGSVYWYATLAVETMVISGIGAGALTTAGVLTIYTGDKSNRTEKQLLVEAEKTLAMFSTTADRIISPLNNVCQQVEKMLQYHSTEVVRKSADDLSELAELFKPKELLGLSAQVTRTLEMVENITFISPLPPMADDTRTLRDINKLKLISTVQENELESEAGRFACTMRKQVMHLQDSLNEMRTSVKDLEKILIPKISEYIRQHRVAH